MVVNFSNFFVPKKNELPEGSQTPQMPSWKHRRRLIYASYVIGAGMIIFGAFIYYSDTQVASQMIIGGVSLISIILTAYTAFATMDDKFHFRDYGREVRYGASENLDGEEVDDYNPDGDSVK
jgi:hypothetical protein